MTAVKLCVCLVVFGALQGCRGRERAASTEPTGEASRDTPSDPAAGQPTVAVAASPPVDGSRFQPDRWYHVQVVTDDFAPVPFFLGVSDGRGIAVIDNGEDRVAAEATVSGDDIRVRFPVFGTELSLRGEDDGVHGSWLVSYRLKRDFDLVARGVPGPDPRLRFPDDGPPAVSMAGQWRVDIEDFGVGRAVFRQDDAGVVTGSLVPPEVGDTRYLSGRVTRDRFAVSTFDGMHAYLVDGVIEDGGARLVGRWVYPGVGSWQFVATRGSEPTVASLVSAKLRDGATRVTLPELDLPRYAGKPVLVDLFGTWCPACLDLTPQLVRLYDKYSGDGLEILSVAIEPPGDDEETDRRLRAYRRKYGIPWAIEVRYVEDFTAVIPPEIENALGFPVTIFVRRDRTVAGVHTAFVSDAARPEHREVIQRFEEWVEDIVRSPAPAPGRQPD